MSTKLHTTALQSTPTCILALGSHTALAIELNTAMACNPMARWDYLFETGECWTDLPTPGSPVDALTALASPLSDASVIAGLRAGR